MWCYLVLLLRYLLRDRLVVRDNDDLVLWDVLVAIYIIDTLSVVDHVDSIWGLACLSWNHVGCILLVLVLRWIDKQNIFSILFNMITHLMLWKSAASIARKIIGGSLMLQSCFLHSLVEHIDQKEVNYKTNENGDSSRYSNPGEKIGGAIVLSFPSHVIFTFKIPVVSVWIIVAVLIHIDHV